jgi:GT2 family glycosyltransferase
MRVSVIVATHNRADRILLCLEALYSQRCTDLEIIVSDDGSEDDTYTRCMHAMAEHNPQRIPTLYTTHQHEGWGLARTRNQGARLARGEMLVFIDSDILLNPNAVGHYGRLYADNPHRVIAGYYKYLKGMEIGLQDVRDWAPVWRMTLPEVTYDQRMIPVGYDVREAMGLHGQLPADLFDDEAALHAPMFSLLGGNMGIPRHVWEQTEGFDEGFTFYGGEDAEYSLQVAQAGFPLSFSREVAGAHMAHPKAIDGVAKDDPVMPYIRQKWPQFFREDGSPTWG